MTWVYLNLTRFCVSVPHTVCIEKNNDKRKQKGPTYQPQSFWACNPKHTHLYLDFDLDLDWFYDISGLDLKKNAWTQTDFITTKQGCCQKRLKTYLNCLLIS